MEITSIDAWTAMQVEEVSRPNATGPRELNVRIRPSAASLCFCAVDRPLISNHSRLSKTKAQSRVTLRITMKRPRRRCFPAEVQCGNGGAKILAAEKFGKAVGRWVMQSPDGFLCMARSSACSELQRWTFRHVDTPSDIKASIVGRLIQPLPSAATHSSAYTPLGGH
jgi:hypothetical protein